MNRKEIEKYKTQTSELDCIPLGLISEDEANTMSWTLKKCLANEKLNNKEIYTFNEKEYIFCIREDGEEYYTNSNYNSKHDMYY